VVESHTIKAQQVSLVESIAMLLEVRLMDCKAAIHGRLLRTVNGSELLQITIPLLSAHTNHTPQSLADLLAHKPLSELQTKLESLIAHSHLNQVTLTLR